MFILGISAYYHDSAAALVHDGVIVAAAQEERFTRTKHDPGFPANALRYCLEEAGITLRDIGFVVFYDKPLLKFERLLETYLACAPRGVASFTAAMPVWLQDKLFLKRLLRKELAALSGLRERELPRLLFSSHHQAHAASAFYPSPFPRAAVLCLDGVGEWATTSAWLGEGSSLVPRWEIQFPHSLGLLYSAFTSYLGFKVNSGEYKLMGLAPYGEPRYADRIKQHIVDIKDDGTFRLNMDYFKYLTGLTMTSGRFHELFGMEPRRPESDLTQQQMDIARSVQEVTEEIVLRLARTVRQELDADHLCLAGGVALNCVANARILREAGYKDLWVQPAAGDAGGAVGAALLCWHHYLGAPRAGGPRDAMQGALLGPRYSMAEITRALNALGARYEVVDDEVLLPRVAAYLDAGAVVGWFQGRMEFGPRALGARSILGDPRDPAMQATMNLKIKFRESFRPFAPSVLGERAADYFELDRQSPYMLLVAPVATGVRVGSSEADDALTGLERLKVPRSTVPAVTHVDLSARVQTVSRDANPRYYALLREFERRTGCPVLVNTSFNVRGEPIVCTPEDAFRCFQRTGMDYLVIENAILAKTGQSTEQTGTDRLQDHALDR